MRFRHLDYPRSTPVVELGAAAIDDLLDRGDLSTWTELAKAITAEPFGAVADTVLRICQAHPMYGTSALWQRWIHNLRRGNVQQRATLSVLRERSAKTQQQVAARMRVAQSDVSKIERRSDMKLSTLRSYVEALGGSLRIKVRLPNVTEELDLELPSLPPSARRE